MPHLTDHPFTTEIEDNYGRVYGDAIDGHLIETSDLILAGYLLARGAEADTVVWSNGSCHWFFVSDEIARDDVKQFLSGDALVDPREMHRCTNVCRAAMGDSDPRPRR